LKKKGSSMAFELNADGDDTYDQEAEEMIRMK